MLLVKKKIYIYITSTHVIPLDVYLTVSELSCRCVIRYRKKQQNLAQLRAIQATEAFSDVTAKGRGLEEGHLQ